MNSITAYADYYKENVTDLDQIEGIWSVNVEFKAYYNDEFIQGISKSQYFELAVIRNGSDFIVCNIDDNKSEERVQEFTPSANPNIYFYRRTFYDEITKANAIISGIGILEFSFEVGEKEMKKMLKEKYKRGMRFKLKQKWIKSYPTKETYINKQAISGTGFAISNDGLIVTCDHVIINADNIKVRGINNNFSKLYNAKVIVADNNNDIAVIQIDDPDFISIENIPYNLSGNSIDVGSSVFALGYPLRSTMGDEIKLTDGLISAKSGYKGDITAYQISVPVQPGNSGGPLFDESGNIVGIINAKNSMAENASYAVKISYLKNLLESLSLKTDFAVTNTLSSK
ncbi:MAG TPA: hypothetical protein DCY06_11385, partial [Bacteroidetes bacterium]|nr:hypothetical protein [Bacteroidota bacterium]